jgi:hypothetical protein
MPLTTYAELQTEVQTWLDRTDIAANVPSCIVLAESYFQRNLRVRQMQASADLTTTAGVATLPTDFLGVIALRRMGNPVTTLTPLGDEEFDRLHGSLTSGTPNSYMIYGSTITIAPVDNVTTMRLRYYQKIPALSVSNTTNWLLTAYPDLYFYGALTEAELLAKDGSSGQGWKSRRDEVCQEIQMSEKFRAGAPGQQIRIQGLTP